MAAKKPCSKLQSFFMTEGRRIIKARMRAESGEKIEAQIANAAIDLGLPFVTCWRAYQGRCGQRAFLTIYAADRALTAQERREDKAAQIVERLERVERSIEGLVDRLEAANRVVPDEDIDRGVRPCLARPAT